MKKILLIKHGSLGDIITSTSVINDIKKHYIGDKIYILTSNKFKDFFNESKFFDKIIIDNRKGLSKTIEVIKQILKLNVLVLVLNLFLTYFQVLQLNLPHILHQYPRSMHSPKE